MNKRLWMLLLVLLIGVLISGCETNINTAELPTTAIPAVSATQQPATLNTEIVAATQADGPDEDMQTWIGFIKSFPTGAQFDDYFESNGDSQSTCGLDGDSPEINTLIAQYRDSDVLVKIQGVLTEDVPDANGCQIRVSKLEEE